MIVFLVGMPGSGKSTIGSLLAGELVMPFFDTDSIIESIEGMTVKEIIMKYGEPAFREMELALVRSWKLEPAIVATGGGMPCHNGVMEMLISRGKTVYLDVPQKILTERLANDESRPLLTGVTFSEKLEELGKLLMLRSPIYESSDIIIDATAVPEKIVVQIISELNQ